MKQNIKKGDEVVVIAGKAKGTRAKVLRVLPEDSRVLVEGVNKHKHFEKKSEQNPNGAVVERENSIHISNVMLAKRFDEGKAGKKK
jgi:large subunit ribosomal protein L24